MTTTDTDPRPRHSRLGLGLLAILLAMHAAYSWKYFGGWAGITSHWPLAGDDHPIAEHNAWITRHFLLQNGTAAGYDPYFMSGYAKSLYTSPSSTLFEVIALITAGRSPVLVHKLITLAGLASLPLLIAVAAARFRVGLGGVIAGVGLIDLYIWSDGGGAGFPPNFARYGMVAYMVAVPLGLIAVATFGRYLELGGTRRWAVAAALFSACFLIHVTSALILAPAGLALHAFHGESLTTSYQFILILFLPSGTAAT